MRTIKFRAWDGNSMLYEGWNGDFFATKEIIFRYDRVQQFTGLLDKNGKEIYEGDILETFEWTYNNIYRTYKVKVVFWNGTFSVEGEREDIDDSDYLWDICRTCEIIGNLYETPELFIHYGTPLTAPQGTSNEQ